MSFVRSIAKKLICSLPLKNTVMLESTPDLSDNTKAVFDEMIARGMNEKYKFIWLIKNKADSSYPKIKNVKYMQTSNSPLLLLTKYMCKCFICCNGWLPSLREGQTSFYLSHGTTIKSLSAYRSEEIDRIDYVLSAAEGVDFLAEKEFGAKKEQLFSLGFPRNDALVKNNIDTKKLFPNIDFDKIIVWYPTYRQHSNGNIVSGGNPLPIIHNSESAARLNELAKEKKLLIVLKPHFAQDISYVKDLGLSNLVFIDDSFFKINGVSSYEFVGSCDALITDYSSIYYDYTLCNRPIALIWEDYEEYKATPGFADDVEPLLDGGEKVYSFDELAAFLENVADGVDTLADVRQNICRKVNHNADANSSCRVVDFIIEKAKL